MILVLGGTGTVGSRLVELLLGKDEQVRVLSREPEKARSRLDGRVEAVRGDLADPGSLEAAFAGADSVFLLTGRVDEPGAQLQQERNAIAAAKQAGVGRVVKLSALGAGAQSPMHFARWHHEAEKELEASGIPNTILRPGGFMQTLAEMVSDSHIYTCAEDGRVALVDARDIAAVAAETLTEGGHEGRAYTLTGPEALSYDDVAEKLSQATGDQIRHVRVPAEGVIAGMANAGLPEWLAQDLAAQFGVFAAGRGAQVSGDVATVTGREPRSLDTFAREEFAAA